jgi:sugar porter (SP) family MFS transporter
VQLIKLELDMDDTIDREQVHRIIKESKPWYRIGSVIKLYFLLLAALMTSSSWGFDLSMTNSLQSVERFMDNFGNPQGAHLGFYGASASVGGIVATFTSGYLVDKLGRRALCAIGSGIVISMAIMQTFSTSFPMFIAGKMILGFGANLQQVGGPVLVVELAHPKSREALTALYNTSIYIGLIAGAWITVGTFRIDSNWSWKIPCILQVVLPGYQFFMIWLCPESPRWLAAKGRTEEARQILIKYHGDGEYNELVRSEMQEILASLEIDKTQVKLNKDGLKSILASRGNLHRLFISFVTAVASQCAGSGLISSYLPAVLDQIGFESSADKTLINGVINIWSWIIGVTAAMLIPKVKRRVVFLTSTSGMLVTFIIWTALSARYLEQPSRSMGIAIVAMIFLYNLFYCACWLPLVVAYPLETVTTKQRGFFFSWTMFCINASSFVVSDRLLS